MKTKCVLSWMLVCAAAWPLLAVSARALPQELNGPRASGEGRDTTTPGLVQGGWNLRELAHPGQAPEHAVQVSLLVPV